MEIKNKKILITGGATRLGKVLTMELLQSGAEVFCHYNNNKNGADQIQNSAAASNQKFHLFQADFTSTQSTNETIDTIIQEAEYFDILINNAAIFFKTPIEEINEHEWDQLFSINLKTPFFISKKIGLIMKKRGSGKIINIGDTSGLNIWKQYIPYSITKSGIIAMTKGLAKALAPEVLVNCINPGPVLLPDYFGESETNQALNKTLLKKAGSPSDIAQTVKYIIEGTDYLTGNIINVDGGRSIN